MHIINMKVKVIIFLVIVVITCMEVYLTRESIMYVISNPKSQAIPTITSILRKVKKFCSSIPQIEDFTFVDVGCGEGEVIKFLTTENVNVKRYIGIDIDPAYIEKAHRNITAPNVTLVAADATSFNYPSSNVIIYLNEPLINMKLEDALTLYTKWCKIFNTIDNVQIFYLNGSISAVLRKSGILDRIFKKVKQVTVGGMFIKRTLHHYTNCLPPENKSK